jgi:hypothetical protein
MSRKTRARNQNSAPEVPESQAAAKATLRFENNTKSEGASQSQDKKVVEPGNLSKYIGLLRLLKYLTTGSPVGYRRKRFDSALCFKK